MAKIIAALVLHIPHDNCIAKTQIKGTGRCLKPIFRRIFFCVGKIGFMIRKVNSIFNL